MEISAKNFSSLQGLWRGKEGKRQYFSILTFRRFFIMNDTEKQNILVNDNDIK